MKAWKVTSERNVELVDMGAQPVAENCVKLKMLTALVGTHESSLYKKGGNSLPIIAGRQGVGMVTEVGENVTAFKRGDKVFIRPVSPCGKCSNCRNGRKSECEHSYVYGKTEDGVLRDFITVPQTDLILLPPQVNETEGVFIEQVALAIETLDRLKIEKGEHIVILGATLAGLIIAQAAIYYQAVPILVDLREDRLALAEKLGIYYTINAVTTDTVKKVFSITCGKMAETMVYTLLSGMTVRRSFENLVRGGRAAFVGFENMDADLNADLMPALEKEIVIYMVSSAGDNYYSAVNILVSNAVDVTSLVSHRIEFDKIGQAIAEVADNEKKYIALLVDATKI
jgi:threonine dehydrogenase-like Zn-dependent dehydrogenase